MPVIKDASLDAAEAELSRAYNELLQWALDNTTSAIYGKGQTDRPIVHIMPQGRRVEAGWYRPSTWVKASAQVAKELGAKTAQVTYDEVFIAGEALAWPAYDLVKLLLHQVCHQLSGVSSVSTYHNDAFASMAYRLGVGVVERHATQGWVDWAAYTNALEAEMRHIAASLDPKAFNVSRSPEASNVGSGKMKLWKCACVGGPSLYTGAVLHATCRKCNQPFKYAHKDRVDPKVTQRIYHGGEMTIDD